MNDLNHFTSADAALADARERKNVLTRVEGIGTDLAPTVHAWKDGSVICVARLDYERLGRQITPDAQFEIFIDALMILRALGGATALSISTEAFLECGDLLDPSISLAASFAIGDPAIRECMTVSYANQIDERRYLAQPFMYIDGMSNPDGCRSVQWDIPASWEGLEADKYSPIPAVLAGVLTICVEEEQPILPNHYIQVKLEELGFEVSGEIS